VAIDKDPLIQPNPVLRDPPSGPVSLMVDRERCTGHGDGQRPVGIAFRGMDEVTDNRTGRTGPNDPVNDLPLPRGQYGHAVLHALDVHGSADPNLHMEPHGPDLCSIVLSHNHNSYLNDAAVIKP
jgi:hypothetical protein